MVFIDPVHGALDIGLVVVHHDGYDIVVVIAACLL